MSILRKVTAKIINGMLLLVKAYHVFYECFKSVQTYMPITQLGVSRDFKWASNMCQGYLKTVCVWYLLFEFQLKRTNPYLTFKTFYWRLAFWGFLSLIFTSDLLSDICVFMGFFLKLILSLITFRDCSAIAIFHSFYSIYK